MGIENKIWEQIELRKKFGDEIFCNPNSRRYPKVLHNYNLIGRRNTNEVWRCKTCDNEFDEQK